MGMLSDLAASLDGAWDAGIGITRIGRAAGPMLRELLGALVWIMANVTYRSFVREGERGFKRLVAFWLGWPGTLVSAFSLRGARRVSRGEVDESEGERELLLEIRRDRSRRLAQDQSGVDGRQGDDLGA